MGTPEDFVEQAEQSHFNREPVNQVMPEQRMLEHDSVNAVKNEKMAQMGVVLEAYASVFKPRYKILVINYPKMVYHAFMTLDKGRARRDYIEALGVGRQLQQDMQQQRGGFMATINQVFGGKNK